MKITQSIRITADPATVFSFFQDVPAVAQCMPGAELSEDLGGGNYRGSVAVRLGPMTARFEGQAEVSSDPDALAGTINGKGVDRRGGSRGNVKVRYQVSAADDGTLVDVDADLTIAGTAAQFGRTGLLNQISQRLISEFVACLEAKLLAANPDEAADIRADDVKGVSLVVSALGSKAASGAKKLLGRD